MTLEERFARIEHVTAGIAEQREKDREEYKALWRDTQRQIDALATTTTNSPAPSRKWQRRIAPNTSACVKPTPSSAPANVNPAPNSTPAWQRWYRPSVSSSPANRHATRSESRLDSRFFNLQTILGQQPTPRPFRQELSKTPLFPIVFWLLWW